MLPFRYRNETLSDLVHFAIMHLQTLTMLFGIAVLSRHQYRGLVALCSDGLAGHALATLMIHLQCGVDVFGACPHPCQ